MNGLLVVGGDMVIFEILQCKTLYFENHYHAYAISVTTFKSLVVNILNRNVFHGHRQTNGVTYIALKCHFLP